MSKEEDSLVVAEDGGLGEKVSGKDIVGEDFMGQLRGNSVADFTQQWTLLLIGTV